MNNNHSIDTVSVLPRFLSSDHNPNEILLRSALEKKSLPLKKVLGFRTASFNKIDVIFSSVNWDYLLSKLNCLDDKMKFLYFVFEELIFKIYSV